MRYVSIDIETLGLDPDFCDIIEFGAVIDDLNDQKPLDELPRYHAYLTKPNDRYQGEAQAMGMHSLILRTIAERDSFSTFMPHDMLGFNFRDWLIAQDFSERTLRIKITVAGKNFMGFDMRFLRRLPNFVKYIDIDNRVLDPAILYVHQEDKKLPSLQTCLDRAGISKTVNHTAVEDAIDVVSLLRRKLLV